MKRAHNVVAATGSYLKTHAGTFTVGMALIWMAAAPGSARGQSTWPSYPNNTAISVTSGGNVGIGTTNPRSKLQLGGYSTFDALDGGANSTDWTHNLYFNGSSWIYLNVGPASLIQQIGGDLKIWTAPSGGAGSTAGLTQIFTVLNGGNVGIGTTNPQYLLSVNGTIGAKDVIVTNTGWSDYVFQPGHRLRPLSEVNAYIQAHHHLPDIPSEAEVHKKGVSVGDMQAKLLAKVEELTLRMIQQETENKELRERIARLEKAAAAGPTPVPVK